MDAANTVVYPRHPPGQDPLQGYAVELLGLVCARGGRRLSPRPAEAAMTQSRILIEMDRARPVLDVFWTMTSREREQRLLPVRLPLARGLLGWRVPLVRRADVARFAGVQRLRDLAALTALQMHDWPDTAVLRANGLPVQTGTNYEALFSMLARGRADYFPRSLLQARAEVEAHRALDLVIEPRLLLYYRAPIYFFVTPTRPELAAELKRGFEVALADGSVERLFHRYFGELVERHQAGSRQLLQLHNPELTELAPLDRKALWLTPPQLSESGAR